MVTTAGDRPAALVHGPSCDRPPSTPIKPTARPSIQTTNSLTRGFEIRSKCDYCPRLPAIVATHDNAVAQLVLDCHPNDDNFLVWSVSRHLASRVPSEVWENKQGYMISGFPNATDPSAMRLITLSQFVAYVNSELHGTVAAARGIARTTSPDQTLNQAPARGGILKLGRGGQETDAGHTARETIKVRECSFFTSLASMMGIRPAGLESLLKVNTLRMPHGDGVAGSGESFGGVVGIGGVGGGGAGGAGGGTSESRVVMVRRSRGWWDWGGGGTHNLLLTRFEDLESFHEWGSAIDVSAPTAFSRAYGSARMRARGRVDNK